MVLSIPMVASVDEGGFHLERGEEHFYRVIWDDGRPIIRVAFAPDGTIRNYERRTENPC